MAETVMCSNEIHAPRPAEARLTWPDGRFYPTTACRSCLRSAINSYVTGEEDGTRHPLLISPVEVSDA